MLKADRAFAHEEQSRILTYNERQGLAIRWICRILAVFAHEACDLARSGAADWSLSRMEPRVSEVLRLLSLQAEASKFVGGNKPYLTDEGDVGKMSTPRSPGHPSGRVTRARSSAFWISAPMRNSQFRRKSWDRESLGTWAQALNWKRRAPGLRLETARKLTRMKRGFPIARCGWINGFASAVGTNMTSPVKAGRITRLFKRSSTVCAFEKICLRSWQRRFRTHPFRRNCP
jgi:hypothetical protein